MSIPIVPVVAVGAAAIAIGAIIKTIAGFEDNITFSVIGATESSYKEFIEKLRARLTTGANLVHGIPVLNHGVPDPQRFVLVDLTNYDDQTVTVAIDVENVYVVAYRVGNRSTFLRQDGTNPPPVDTLFPDTVRQTLGFTGGYPDLQSHARNIRDKNERLGGREFRQTIGLGLTSLDNAITELRVDDHQRNNYVARSLIIIIEMVSEAARFRYIEEQIGFAIGDARTYEPDPLALSLENNWQSLSEQIQRSSNGGNFRRTIMLNPSQGQPFRVVSIESPIESTEWTLRDCIALILYYDNNNNC